MTLTPRKMHQPSFPALAPNGVIIKTLLLFSVHKNPLLSLICLRIPSPPKAPLPILLPGLPPLDVPRMLSSRSLPFPTPPFSILNPFQPSNSLSNRNAFSFSSLRSRSARRAASWLLASSACSSSMVRSKRSILSRPLAISSWSCCVVLSRRAI